MFRKMSSSFKKPKLLVFDLDYTLWPFWVDTHVTPPFRKSTSGEVLDAHAQKVKHYPEVPRVLETLKRQGYILGIASRTGEIDGANQLLQLFNWDKYFTYKQIYPGCKVNHFNKIRKDSGIEFDEIIFFDDEQRNIQDLTRKGVMSVLVKSGVNAKVVDDAIANFGS